MFPKSSRLSTHEELQRTKRELARFQRRTQLLEQRLRNNQQVFVDFESITDDLVSLNLWRSDKIMMEDDISDLPGNTIYELNTSLFRSGHYTIELVTLQGVKIHKKITIE